MVFSEIEQWGRGYSLDLTFDETKDITDVLLQTLEQGNMIHPDFPDTIEGETEHYNDTITYR